MTGRDAAGRHSLAVDRNEFMDALKAVAKFKRRGGGFVRFAYADGELAIAMPDVTIRVTAQRSWPTEVTLVGGWVKAMAKVRPAGDPIDVTYDGTQVRIGTTVIPAVRAK